MKDTRNPKRLPKYYYDLAYDIGERYFDKILVKNIHFADAGIWINTRNIKKELQGDDFLFTMNVVKDVYVHWNVGFVEKRHWWHGKEIHIIFQSKKFLFAEDGDEFDEKQSE